MDTNRCFHCGLAVPFNEEIVFRDHSFCCRGCQTIFEIFSDNGLDAYYDLERSPGARPLSDAYQFDFLANEQIVAKLLSFDEANTQIVCLNIPHIHCSSCIWILENLRKLNPGITSSQVNFHEKSVRITYNATQLTLKQVVELLCNIGYEPYISLEQYGKTTKNTDHSQTYKLGVAFFCFGNIMLLSFPEYFELQEFWLDHYKGFFRLLIFLLALPSFLYSASGYYTAAWKSLRTKRLNIEIPIALGIIVMFLRSVVDMWFDHGPGFFDSLTGLIFFMLLGKTFQAKTYRFLSFERDYKSYFPVAVTRLGEGREQNIPIHDIEPGDRLLIRNQELIPADGILMTPTADVDYSFVTGESVPVRKQSGDKLFAGGRLQGAPIEMDALQSVSQSYLTQLWSNAVFAKRGARPIESITNAVSQYFTPVLLAVAFAGLGYWSFIDRHTAFNVFTAVLIVACPCALALTAPFTLGNVLRLYGRAKLYLKDANVIERMAKIDTLVFDKTGTITSASQSQISYQGSALSGSKLTALKNAVRASNHPLSRLLYQHLPATETLSVDTFEETPGQGLEANILGHRIRVGSAPFVGAFDQLTATQTKVFVSIDDVVLGVFTFHSQYRDGLQPLLAGLAQHYTIKVLSGDNDGERQTLEKLLPPQTEMVFDQKPDQKLAFIKQLQDNGHRIMMIGDGLNDAGALAQSDVGIAISENVNVFSPACDGILDASAFAQMNDFMRLSKKAMRTIRWSFALSLLYNIVGLSFALSGQLLPLVAAIIMPLSTVTIIGFVTLLSNFDARRLQITRQKPKHDKYHGLGETASVILNYKSAV
ncbi:heavy metal translocating P-type ATPase [Flavobacterium caeni]|uniref:Cu+-exporting ATPase n=1 Tax=Flavobacterium caeni TaxID=490189 RepID=A0A1G5CZJ4_9FLAO|nr:heavy metal translocating P-type ATPase metal-binding domain-containing protein [Flavobacterium caeni]SCY07668.1 Cu+-exporting ATPase [Flavobacterium caeni]